MTRTQTVIALAGRCILFFFVCGLALYMSDRDAATVGRLAGLLLACVLAAPRRT